VALHHSPGQLLVDAQAVRAFVISQDDDTVTVINARTGALLRTISVDTPPAATWVSCAATLDEQAGRVVVAGHDASTARMVVLDARSGAILHTVPIHIDPIAMAMDTHAHRVV